MIVICVIARRKEIQWCPKIKGMFEAGVFNEAYREIGDAHVPVNSGIHQHRTGVDRLTSS